MTAINQDFELYRGDDAKPIFTILDGAGVAINLVGVTEIQWLLVDGSGTTQLTKLKTTGGVTFVGTGSDGKIYIVLVPTDSAPAGPALGLDGWYFHSVRITDATGKLSVVEVGRLLVKVRERGE